MKALLLLLFFTSAACAESALDRLLSPLPKVASASSLPTRAESAAKPAFSLKADALVTELEKQAAQHFSMEGELKLSLARVWPALRLPEADWILTVTEWPAGGLSATLLVRVKIVSGSETIIEGQLPLRAQLWQEVWFASNQIDRGQSLDRSSLTSQKADVLRERIPLVSAKIEPSTLELSQAVSAGRALTRRDVTVRPLIRKGQVVEAFAQSGQFGVRMKALAMENGAAGDLIKLQNIESRKEFHGQVTHESKVQIHF